MGEISVGFIGIGTMGKPMAAHIGAAGFALHVQDIDPAAAREFAETHGATAHPTPLAVAGAADLVVTMLPTGADVRAVALGPDGIAEGFSAKSPAANPTLIDMSSSEPAGTVALAAELAARGVDMLDAPVSGGLAKAIDGTLTLMVGGGEDVIERCRPVLSAMGTEIIRAGDAGAGHAIKAINNLLNAIGLLAGGEALMIGKRFGLSPDVMLDVINVSTGRNHATEHKFRRHILSRGFASGFSLDLMVKDLGIALGLADETGTPTPFSALALELWKNAQRDLGPGHDHTEIVRWVEQLSNTELTSGG